MNGNYIMLYRSLLEWEWYTDINTCRLFIHMLLKANWKDGKFQGKEIKRGSFVSSIRTLADETKLTEREIRTAISHLKATHEVTSKSYNKYTVFTVINYDAYQVSDAQNDNQPTINRQSNDNQTTTIEKGNKGRRKENNKVIVGKVFPPDSIEMWCVEKIIASNRESVPNAKVPCTDEEKQKWAVHIDRLRRIDKASDEDIKRALLYATSDSFWKSNVRSTSKFREKYETLLSQSKSKNQKQIKKFNNFQGRDYNMTDLEKRLLQ